MLRVSLLLVLLTQGDVRIEPPQLRFEAPAELASARMRLESFDTNQLADVVRLVGLRTPGPPIRVQLATDSSEWAENVPRWVAGYALAGSDAVVIFPSRSPSYPDRTLNDVLRHEVAHILISRASSRRPLPRWFNEGLAMSAEREWRFRDQTQLFFELVSGPRKSLDTLDQLFQGTERDQSRAYLLSGAFVRGLLNDNGEATAGRILENVARGNSFESAFADVMGRSTAAAESDFWKSQRVWTSWMPVLFSQEVLWLAVTLLALLAIYRRRRRNAEIRKRWEKEDGPDSGA
ncbi:MAG TPA: hypothetical protein VFE29_01225 [Terriglobia bacterium]|nr:hypothetical protein [Terriglobia bacterium]